MRVNYDVKTDTLTVIFREVPVAESDEDKPGVILDYDAAGNVFLDLGFSKAEAENLKLRSELMLRIEEFYVQSCTTQAEAARVLGLTQPRLNALLKGKIGLFSLDALVNVAGRAGMDVRLVVKKAA